MSTVMVLTRAQYCLLRSIGKTGVPSELLAIFLNRCGASSEEWHHLIDAGLVEQANLRYQMTEEGKRVYRRRPKNIYF